MQERKRFNVVESSLDKNTNSIDLEIGDRKLIPFTGSELVFTFTGSGEKVIVKIPSNNYQARHEWVGLGMVQMADISVPVPIALINHSAGQLAIVSGFVEGDNLYFNPNPDIKVEVGRQIKKMHQHTQINGKGWELSGRNTFIYYDKHIFSWATGKLKELQTDSRTTSLLAKLTDTMESFCKDTKPVFNHNDLHDGQIITDRDGNPTIIDFANWTEESWLNDLGYHLFHLVRTERVEPEDFTNFLSGYLEKDRLSEVEKSTLAFYLLFISARALNYFNRRQSSYLSTAKENHQKVLDYLEDETIWKKY